MYEHNYDICTQYDIFNNWTKSGPRPDLRGPIFQKFPGPPRSLHAECMPLHW